MDNKIQDLISCQMSLSFCRKRLLEYVEYVPQPSSEIGGNYFYPILPREVTSPPRPSIQRGHLTKMATMILVSSSKIQPNNCSKPLEVFVIADYIKSGRSSIGYRAFTSTSLIHLDMDS